MPCGLLYLCFFPFLCFLEQLLFGYLCFIFAPFRTVFGYFRFAKSGNPANVGLNAEWFLKVLFLMLFFQT